MANAKKSNFKKNVFKTKRKYPKKAVKVSVKKAVESVLSRKIEPKQCGNNPAVYVWNALNSTMSAPIDLGVCFGSVIQGTQDGQRIGNRIDVTKAVLNLNMLASSVAGNLPCILTIFIGYTKGKRSVTPSSADTVRIFNDGNTSTGMTGLTLDLLRTINNDVWTVKRYDFKLGNSEGGTIYPNNDFPVFVNKKISLAPLLGQLIYTNDQFDNYNKNLYMFCQWTNINSLASSYPPILNYYVDGLYKDM